MEFLASGFNLGKAITFFIKFCFVTDYFMNRTAKFVTFIKLQCFLDSLVLLLVWKMNLSIAGIVRNSTKTSGGEEVIAHYYKISLLPSSITL